MLTLVNYCYFVLGFFVYFFVISSETMAVEQFVSKTLELLQEEREAEIEETRYVKSCIIAHVNPIMISESDNSFIMCWKIL